MDPLLPYEKQANLRVCVMCKIVFWFQPISYHQTPFSVCLKCVTTYRPPIGGSLGARI